MIRNSRLRVRERTLSGATNAVIPITKPMLAMFEPIALPIEIPGLPRHDAIADTKISGAEVPIPTMVRPIIKGEIPRLRAAAEAPRTNRSELQTSNARPMTTVRAGKSIRVSGEMDAKQTIMLAKIWVQTNAGDVLSRSLPSRPQTIGGVWTPGCTVSWTRLLPWPHPLRMPVCDVICGSKPMRPRIS